MTILIRKVIKKMLLLGIILIEVYAILFMHFFFTMSWYLPDNPIEWTIWSNLEVISEYLIIAIMVFVILLCLASLIISNVIISKSIWILLSSVGIIVACIQGYNFVTFDIPYFAKLGYTHSILFMLLFPHTIAITSCILLSCVWVNSRFQVIDLKMIEIKKNKYEKEKL